MSITSVIIPSRAFLQELLCNVCYTRAASVNDILDSYEAIWSRTTFEQFPTKSITGEDLSIEYSQIQVVYPLCINDMCGLYYKRRLRDNWNSNKTKVNTITYGKKELEMCVQNHRFICLCRNGENCPCDNRVFKPDVKWSMERETCAIYNMIALLGKKKNSNMGSIYAKLNKIVLVGFDVIDTPLFAKVKEFNSAIPLTTAYLEVTPLSYRITA